MQTRQYRWQHLVGFLLVLLTLVEGVALMSAAWPFDTDDAFITLRYARHWVEGHGIVWNPGERPPVEGYSNFSFLVLGALALKLGVDPLVVLKIAGAGGMLVTCVLLYVLSRRWLGPVASAVPGLLFLNYRGTVYWGVSGLETGFFVCLAVATVTVLFLALGFPARPVESESSPLSDGPRPSPSIPLLAVTGCLAFLAGITRPDGPAIFVIAAATAGAYWARRRARGEAAPSELRGLLVLAATFGIPFGLYFGWRLLYFGRLFPNSVVCKGAYTGDPLELTRDFLGIAGPFLLLALVQRKWDVRLLAMLGPAVLWSVALIGADPIIGHHLRHFLPAFALVLVLATIGVVNLLSLIPHPRMKSGGAELAVALVAAVLAATQAGPLHDFFHTDSRFYANRQEMRRSLGEVLNRLLDENETYVVGDAGMTPWVTRTRVIDAFCLNNRAFTEPPISFSMERFLDDLLGNRKPEAIVVVSRTPDRFEPWSVYGFAQDIAAHEAFQQQYRSILKFPTPGDTFHSFVFLRADIAEERTAKLRAGM